VGHRPTGPLARWWFGSVGTYLVKHLRCSVLVAQTEISDDQFAQLTMAAAQAQFCRANHRVPSVDTPHTSYVRIVSGAPEKHACRRKSARRSLILRPRMRRSLTRRGMSLSGYKMWKSPATTFESLIRRFVRGPSAKRCEDKTGIRRGALRRQPAVFRNSCCSCVYRKPYPS
jgi:hypothetical protein